ncbi:MAG: 3-oxoacyl-[acyl-carrier-protein] synthase III C-terminal domain-containing protein, partial [Pirellulales bacterium]
ADVGDTRAMLKAAGQACLANARCDANEIDLVVHTGVYRSEYISEPALASILAGDLGINASIELLSDRSSFAFDLMNGAVGFLNACCVVAQMMEARDLRKSLVITSEIDNNAGTPLSVDIEPTASALILDRTTDRNGAGGGFGRFLFRSFAEHIERLTARTEFSENQLKLRYQRDEEIEGVYLRVIPEVVNELLQRERLSMQDIRWIVAPQISREFLVQLACSLDVSQDRLIDVTEGRRDLTTSSLPYSLAALHDRGDVNPGDRCLMISAGSGVEIGCAIYQY